jgi:hypothetical protein
MAQDLVAAGTELPDLMQARLADRSRLRIDERSARWMAGLATSAHVVYGRLAAPSSFDRLRGGWRDRRLRQQRRRGRLPRDKHLPGAGSGRDDAAERILERSVATERWCWWVSRGVGAAATRTTRDAKRVEHRVRTATQPSTARRAAATAVDRSGPLAGACVRSETRAPLTVGIENQRRAIGRPGCSVAGGVGTATRSVASRRGHGLASLRVIPQFSCVAHFLLTAGRGELLSARA